MTGRPDYGAGDLVVCVNAGALNLSSGMNAPAISALTIRRCYLAERVFRDADGDICVILRGVRSPHCNGSFAAERFRRIDPKPPEFFTGKIETVREGELA